MTQLTHYRGALLGLATGDALGTPIEFEPPGTFVPLDDIVGGGPFDLEAGQWTDDTSPEDHRLQHTTPEKSHL